MALLTVNFESGYLNGNTEIGIILPDKPRDIEPKTFYQKEKKFPVLWLLHGLYGDYSDWIRKSMIELYACENNLAVVMPSALNSEYANWPLFANGYRMYDYFINELMDMVYAWFPISNKREDNFIAGLSMGGNGALKFSLSNPEKFAGAAILSSAPWYYEEDRVKVPPARQERMVNLFSQNGGYEETLDSTDNVWRLAEERAADPTLPKFYFTIGENDPNMERFERFRKHAEEIDFKAKFEIIPGYTHEWRFWDLAIQKSLDFFGFFSAK